jgi:GNAT superfamily N-acetyltransferase
MAEADHQTDPLAVARSRLSIVSIDPDSAAMAEWLAVCNASVLSERPDEPPLQLEEARGLAKGNANSDRLTIIASDGGRAIGAAGIVMPTKDNLTTLQFVLHVHPKARRRGVGSVLMEHISDVARVRGRSSISTSSEFAVGAVAPGVGFAKKHGFAPALRESLRVLRLPLDEQAAAELAAAAAGPSAAYHSVAWRDRFPDELIDGIANLETQMSVDMPTGDLVKEEQVWDAARLRLMEETAVEMGNVSYYVAAVEGATKVVAAYTLIAVNEKSRETGRQFVTVVGREHRGHRLGILVKLANLRQVMELSPETVRIQSWNADTNEHMIRVNDRLGFEVKGQSIAWQKHLLDTEATS